MLSSVHPAAGRSWWARIHHLGHLGIDAPRPAGTQPPAKLLRSSPLPPTQLFIAMLRTRGTVWPRDGPELGRTVDLSAGHFQMPTALPQ